MPPLKFAILQTIGGFSVISGLDMNETSQCRSFFLEIPYMSSINGPIHLHKPNGLMTFLRLFDIMISSVINHVFNVSC